MVCDEAEVTTTWLHAVGLGLKFVTGEVEVDLLGAELEGMSSVCQ